MTSTYAARPLPVRLPPARLLGIHTELALALALLPVVRIWDLTDDLSTSLSTAALFAAAAWLIWQLTPRHLPASSRSARVTAGVALGVAAWQLAWVDGNDFWFYRAAIIVWAAAWLLIWWGWSGLLRGWRVLAAFTLWAIWCDGPWRWMRDALQSGDRFGPQLARATARAASWSLALIGTHPIVQDNLLTVRGRTVSVGVPCTALPLAKLLILLLALAVLLFRLPWIRAFALGIAALAIAFATSVARVDFLALLARNPDRFRFWHEPGSGGQWFTAAAMAALAALFVRALPPVTAQAWPGGPAPAPALGRWIAVGGVVMLALARMTAPRPPQVEFSPTPGSGLHVVSDSSEPLDLGPAGGTHANEPAWIRRITCADATQMTRLELTLAYVPQMLAGDIRPEDGDWRVSGNGRYATHATVGRVVWVATLAPDGDSVATNRAWARKVDRGLMQPRRWAAWLFHHRPLRDKRAYWAEAEWNGPAERAPARPPEPFSGWIAGAGAPHLPEET